MALIQAVVQTAIGVRLRRKAVDKFRFRDGLWILVIITVFLIALLFLMLHGYINIDRD
jgi:heme/copper-type cytochrome/quinol oxidase subunit 4